MGQHDPAFEEDVAYADLDILALRVSLLELLDEQQHMAEVWMQQHHASLRQSVERMFGVGPKGGFTRPEEPHTLASEDTSEEADPEVVTRRTSKARGHLVKTSSVNSLASMTSQRSNFVQALTESEEQPQPMCCRIWRDLVRNPAETIMGLVILANTVVMCVQLELNGVKGDAALQSAQQRVVVTTDDVVPRALQHGVDFAFADQIFGVFAHVFTVVFIIELCVRLCVQRSKYFLSAFNLLDLVVVLVTSMDMYVLSNVREGSSNISFLRTMRMLRLARLLRVIRMMGAFQKLRVLMNTMFLSFLSTLWSMTILCIFMLVSALLLCQVLQDFILDDAADLDLRRWAHRYYGTTFKALYTMYEATFSGCWPTYARPLIEGVSPWYACLFVPYVTFVIFTLIRIIYALLLKDTLQAAATDADAIIQDKIRETKNLVKKLSDLFAEADKSGDGFLNREEFAVILGYPKVQTWMSSLGVDAQDSQALFDILEDSDADADDPNAKISYEEFVHGIMRMKSHGQLTSSRDTHRILKHCEALRKEVGMLVKRRNSQGGSDALRSSGRRKSPQGGHVGEAKAALRRI